MDNLIKMALLAVGVEQETGVQVLSDNEQDQVINAMRSNYNITDEDLEGLDREHREEILRDREKDIELELIRIATEYKKEVFSGTDEEATY